MSRSSTALLGFLTLVGLAALGSVRAAAPAPIPAAPDVTARAYMLTDFQSGRILAQSHADERMEPASLTKLMTAYVVFTALKENRLKLSDQVTISEHAWRAEGSRTFVQVGTQIPVDILIKGMIIQSGNDATIALAEKVGGTEPAFAQIMNEYAKRLGMNATHFDNSDGLPSPTHYTTAHDMTTLAKSIIRDFPEYYPLFSMHEFLWNNIKQENRNGLLSRDPSVDGLKTGHTDSAGFCLVTSAKRDGMRLISVVMGSPSVKAREDASAALLSYGYTFYETSKLKSAHDAVLKPHVFKGETDYVSVGVPSDIIVTIGRGQAASLTTAAKLTKEPLIAPIAAGQTLGELTVTDAAGQIVARTPLVALAADPAGGLWTRASDSIRLWFH
jgi:D-alanyl-D-alanine carboxypeptidase (penicillin-binding protein 5/6)